MLPRMLTLASTRHSAPFGRRMRVFRGDPDAASHASTEMAWADSYSEASMRGAQCQRQPRCQRPTWLAFATNVPRKTTTAIEQRIGSRAESRGAALVAPGTLRFTNSVRVSNKTAQ